MTAVKTADQLLTTGSLAAPGDTVLVEQYRNVSGVSSVPLLEPIGEVIGTLTQTGSHEYTVVDNGQTIATITGVYHEEEDGSLLLLLGWVNGQWARWAVTN